MAKHSGIAGVCVTCRVVAALTVAGLGIGAGAPARGAGAEPSHPEASVLDCVGSSRALEMAPAISQRRDGDELHQYWVLHDRPDLWGSAAPRDEALERYRDRIREIVPDASPLGLIRRNREVNAWLEREHPAERRINELVEAGAGIHRPMNCLETQVLAFQARRFPLYEQPSEILAFFVERTEPDGDLVKVYAAADGDAVVPKPYPALEAVERDVAAGWRLTGVFHNHTFNHAADRGLLPVASPSASDIQVSVGLVERLGLETLLVADGLSTLVLTGDEVRELAAAIRAAE